MLIATAEDMREADRRMAAGFALPTLLLMETAGRKVADFLLKEYPEIQNFLLLCGPGHNGGDGLCAARHLKRAGKLVGVVLCADAARLPPDTAANLAMLQRLDVPIAGAEADELEALQPFLRMGAVVVDALLGTGVRGAPREDMARVLDFFRPLPYTVVAVDLPSGLRAETGEVTTAPLRATHTLALALPKRCHYITPAATYCGQVHVLDIGLYEEVTTALGIRTRLITDDTIRAWYRPRTSDSHKGSYGHALLAGGSKGRAGAIALAAQSNLEMGGGLTTAFIPASAACSFHRTTLENMSVPYGAATQPHLNETAAEVFASYLADKAVVGIGPGLGVNEDTYNFLRLTLPRLEGKPVLLDADALNLLAEHDHLWPRLPTGSVITPHPGEMGRLTGLDTAAVQRHRLELALELARARNVIVVLKGAGTLVAAPDGTCYVNAVGNAGMATAGSGDVLAGAICGLIAQGYSPLQAAVMGTYLHGRAGDRVARNHGLEGVVASKIMRALGVALREALAARYV